MKTLLFLLLTIFVLPFSTPAGMHPVYVSVTTIDFNEKEKSLELTCRVFTNDYERVLRKLYRGKVDLIGKTRNERMDSLTAAYMFSHLELSVNGKKADLKFIGFEQDEDAILNYLEIEGIEDPKDLVLKNTVLYDLWEKQQSVVHVTMKGQRKSTRLTNPLHTAEFHF